MSRLPAQFLLYPRRRDTGRDTIVTRRTPFQALGFQLSITAVSMMNAILQEARHNIDNFFSSYPWTEQLASILPLSSLIDFIETPLILHTYQLALGLPLWCWAVTPAGSRFLLEHDDARAQSICYLDRYGVSNPNPLDCLDGKFGDRYIAANSTTLRLCIQALRGKNLVSRAPNPESPDWRHGPQTLDVIYAERIGSEADHQVNSNPQDRSRAWRKTSVIGAGVGYALLVALIAISSLLGCYLTITYLAMVIATGVVISATHGGTPCHLATGSHSQPASFPRLVLATENMNDSHWIVIIGESGIVNSLCNWPLKRLRQVPVPAQTFRRIALLLLLKALIVGQWLLAIASAALQGLDAYLITFWFIFCIMAHQCLFPPQARAQDWLRDSVGLQFKCYTAKLSTRRALVTCVLTLNPDTFQLEPDGNGPVQLPMSFDQDALRWIDPILVGSQSRTLWEKAVLKALLDRVGRPGMSYADLTQLDLEAFRTFGAAGLGEQDGALGHWSGSFTEGVDAARRISDLARVNNSYLGLIS